MRTSWNVGLAAWAFAPVPWATPRTKLVFPAPSSPVRRTMSPGFSLAPSSIPTRSVSAGELVTSSGKVVVAGALEVSAGDLHGFARGHRADHVQAGFGDRTLRARADQLRLLATCERLLERRAGGAWNLVGVQLAADARHGRELLHLPHQAVRDVAAAQAQVVEPAAFIDQGNKPVRQMLAQSSRRAAERSGDTYRPSGLRV